MKFLTFILACYAFTHSVVQAQVDLEIAGEAGYESRYRLTGDFDISRTFVGISSRYTPSVLPIEFKFEGWAWKNFSAQQNQLAESEVSLRELSISQWLDWGGYRAGLQSVQWGETFGYRPLDLVQTRNYRDYSFLDTTRSRIPVLAINATWMWEDFRGQLIFNPRSERPILSATVNGVTIINEERDPSILNSPEFGTKVGITKEGYNLDLYWYRHLSRSPKLVSSLNSNAVPVLTTFYDQVHSTGGSFSMAISDWVLRTDALATFNQPFTGSNQTQTTYSLTTGTDYSPSSIEGLTVGVQGHIDRYNIIGSPVNLAASALVRKAFLQGKLSFEGQVYQSLTLRDQWLTLQSRLFFLEQWEIQLGAEWVSADPLSPFYFFDGVKRVSTELTLRF